MKDVWEDGIPLTSGRSGLASAVIYQPSCPQNYSQDCLASLSSNREYDDDRKPPDNNDDDADISSRGTGSSYHLNCSSNFFSGGSGGQHDFEDSHGIIKKSSRVLPHTMTERNSNCRRPGSNLEPFVVESEPPDQGCNEGRLLLHVMKEINAKFHEHCASEEPAARNQLKQEYNESHIRKLCKFHLQCTKHSLCPLQRLKRRFRQFLSNRKNSKATDKLCKSKGI